MGCGGWQTWASSGTHGRPIVAIMIDNWSTSPAAAAEHFARRLAVE
jgi:hypothetical protein